MSSRPLFMSVAESTEILRPMTQFGCAQACSGVTGSSAPRRPIEERAARGREQHRRTPRGASPHARRAAGTGRSHCARCRSAAVWRRRRARLHEQRPRHDQRFLVGEQQALARPRGGERGAQTGGADDRGHDVVDFGQRGDLRQRVGARRARASSAPRARSARFERGARPRIGERRVVGASKRAHCSASFSTLRFAPSATTRKRSGWRAITSSVCSPIEPVEPRIATPFTSPTHGSTRGRSARTPARAPRP